MKSAVETLSPTRVKLSVEVSFEELEPYISNAYKAFGERINIPGFRKGKVPTRVIDQRVGRGAVLEEAINDAVPAAFDEAVKENKIVPVGRPVIDITEIVEDSHVAFTAEVEVRPEFDLPNFDSLKIEVDAVEIDPDAMQEQIDGLRSRFATYKAVERAAAIGDVLLVDISGSLDGEEISDLQASALSYELGTDGMLPGFDEAVAGANTEDVRTFTFVPEAGEHAGRDISVAVTVRAVRERELPPFDDGFAQLASEFDTAEELRADVEKRLARLKRMEQGYQAREKVQDALLAAVDFPLPEGIVQAEVEEHFQDGHGDDAHKAEYVENSRKSLKAQFIFDKIAETEELSVSEQELSAWLIQNAPRYNMSPQDFADALVRSGGVQMAVADVRRAKALEVAIKAAQIVDSKGVIINLEDLDQDLAELS